MKNTRSWLKSEKVNKAVCNHGVEAIYKYGMKAVKDEMERIYELRMGSLIVPS